MIDNDQVGTDVDLTELETLSFGSLGRLLDIPSGHMTMKMGEYEVLYVILAPD